MTFSIDSKTRVEARGGSTESRRAAAAGKPGQHLDQVLQTGQSVAVTYNDMAGSLARPEIKAIPKASAARRRRRACTLHGVVKSIGADSITINGSIGGGGSFEQTFKIDPKTKVVRQGRGHGVAAKGGRAPFTALVANGDYVSVSYHKTGQMPGQHAVLRARHREGGALTPNRRDGQKGRNG